MITGRVINTRKDTSIAEREGENAQAAQLSSQVPAIAILYAIVACRAKVLVVGAVKFQSVSNDSIHRPHLLRSVIC